MEAMAMSMEAAMARRSVLEAWDPDDIILFALLLGDDDSLRLLGDNGSPPAIPAIISLLLELLRILGDMGSMLPSSCCRSKPPEFTFCLPFRPGDRGSKFPYEAA
jgi:hypothetical protein